MTEKTLSDSAVVGLFVNKTWYSFVINSTMAEKQLSDSTDVGLL